MVTPLDLIWVVPVGGGLGAALSSCAVMVAYPDVRKRVARSIMAHLPFRHKGRRLDIEMAMHLSADVDMEWWQRQFDALLPKPPRSSRHWYQDANPDVTLTLGRLQESIARAQDPAPPSVVELNGWARGGITSVTDGNVTHEYYVKPDRKIHEVTSCGDCEYVQIAAYADPCVKPVLSKQCNLCEYQGSMRTAYIMSGCTVEEATRKAKRRREEISGLA